MKKKSLFSILFLMLAFLLLDQITKWLVTQKIAYGTSILILSFFKLTYVKNTGAAWSMFTGNQLFLILMSFLFLFFFFLYLYKKKTILKSEILIYASLLGGIFGNLIDRIRLNYVIDFFDFEIFGYHFPVFNVADILIVLAGLALMIKIMKEGNSYEV